MAKLVLPADLSRVTTYPLAARSNKVRVDEFARPVSAASSLGDFLDGLPDVLAVKVLRELAVAANLGNDLSGFATANLDMVRHDRTDENVLRRPTLGKGRSFGLTGHHELTVPLLAAAVGLERARRDSGR